MSSFFSVVKPMPSKPRRVPKTISKTGRNHPWKSMKKRANSVKGGLKRSASGNPAVVLH